MAVKGAYDASYITAGDMTADVDGASENCTGVRKVGYWATWDATGSPVGNIVVQGSMDGTNWEDLTDMTYAAGGAAGTVMLEYLEPAFRFVRCKYDFTSGGTANTSFAVQRYFEHYG